MKKYSLEIVVFLCGASLMILELAGSRVLAPYVGTSIVVWTSLIGIIMGALSLGYWAGGKIADRGAEPKILSLMILVAALLVLAIVFSGPALLAEIRLLRLNIYLGAVVSALFLFAGPSFLLGIVSPYAVKLKIKDPAFTGRTVGDLYAISTMGSIAGTFAAGFALIPFFGTIRILYFISAVLILSSLLVWPFKFFKTRILAILILAALIIFSFIGSARAAAAKLVDVDSQYSRIWIYPGTARDSRRPILNLSNDPFGTQSAMFLDRDNDLVFKYAKYYRLADVVNPKIENSLMLGGAAYSYPKDFLKNHPNANLDVVEIDPKMTELAKKYFSLPDDSRLKIYHEDGRVFLNNNQKKYDSIYIDAFTSHLSVPYQLTTKEAVEKIYGSLNDNGAVIINIISAPEGEKGKFFRAEYATYKEIFPQLYVFRVYNLDPARAQNLMLVAVKSGEPVDLKSDNAEFFSLLDMLWRRPIPADLPILTDDYAPVDYYTMKMI